MAAVEPSSVIDEVIERSSSQLCNLCCRALRLLSAKTLVISSGFVADLQGAGVIEVRTDDVHIGCSFLQLNDLDSSLWVAHASEDDIVGVRALRK